MYHAAWEVGELTDLARARARLLEAGALVGQSDHGTSLSLYAKDPDGLEFELFWTVPDGTPVGTRPLDLERELARRGLAVG
jgi:catechol-2,3-dioxygenase